MLDLRRLATALILAGSVATAAPAATPCTGVDRTLPPARKLVLARAAARQLGLPNVDVIQSFQINPWRIVYVTTGASDNAFLFYAGDPALHKYVTLWAGAAMPSEETAIDDWTLKNAPGIPPKLAACFAWHVTKDRDE